MDIHRRNCSLLRDDVKKRHLLLLFHVFHDFVRNRGEESLYSDLENNIWEGKSKKVSMAHSAEKSYQTKHCTIERLSNQCRTYRSHPEPFLTCDFTNSEQCPSIWKCTSKVAKNTTESDTRDRSENGFIASLILPKARYGKHLYNIENSSIENDTTKSQKDNLTRSFPTIHFGKYVAKNIGKWKKDSACIKGQTSKLRHLGRSNIWDDEDNAEKCDQNGKSKRVHKRIISDFSPNRREM